MLRMNATSALASSQTMASSSASESARPRRSSRTIASPKVLAVSASDMPYRRWQSGRSRITHEWYACPSSWARVMTSLAPPV